MKKFNFDDKFKQIAILTFLVIASAIIFEKTIGNLSAVWDRAILVFNFITGLLSPFVFGFAMSYLLNPGLRFIEKNISKISNFSFKIKRLISLTIVYLLFFLTLIIIITSIIPSVVESSNSLLRTLPTNFDQYSIKINELFQENKDGFNELSKFISLVSLENISVESIMADILKPINSLITNLPEIISKILLGTINIAGMLVNIILGVVISIYMLYDKEYFGEIGKRFLNALFKKKTANATMSIIRLSNTTFEKFIIGKSIDSFIIGILFFIICLFLKIEYAPLLAIIIAITNMIPYFGPFIGAIPVLLIVSLTDIGKTIPMGICILLLQQFDGIILGPKILGDSIGLKPISIILAILIGGGLIGPVGMFLGAPIFAVLATIVSETINQLEKSKE